MFTFEITFLPASLPSLASSYQRVRMAVGYPDGGISNNMAVAFLPGAVLDAGGVGFDPDNGTASWSAQPMPQPRRPSSNDALAFLAVRIVVTGICVMHVQSAQRSCTHLRCLCVCADSRAGSTFEEQGHHLHGAHPTVPVEA